MSGAATLVVENGFTVTAPPHLFAALKRVLSSRGMDRVLLRSTRDERE